MLGAGPADLLPAERAGLLSRTQDGRYALRHPLLRAAILDGAPLDQKLGGHRALGAVLQADGELDRGSWHLAQAATGPDAELAEALEGPPGGRRPVAGTPARPPPTSGPPNSPTTAGRSSAAC